MRPVPVVVIHEVSKDSLEMPGIQNEQPVEPLGANSPHEPLRHAVRLRGPKRRPNDLNVLLGGLHHEYWLAPVAA